MSGQGASARIPKSSPNLIKQGPLKATIPISSVMKSCSGYKTASSNTVSPTYLWKNRGSPDRTSGQRSPGSAGYKAKPISYVNDDAGNSMRRTASMDAIYLKGHWPKDGFYWQMGVLQVNEATQTDESDLSDLRQIHCISETEDKRDKLTVRPRIWNTKEVNVRHGSPGEHTLNSSSQTVSSYVSQPMSINLKPLHKPSMRSSVEGLNQEIERLVLKTDTEAHSCNSCDVDRYSESIPEGHRAPVADLFRYGSRSVDTQTPQHFGNGSSGESQGSSPDQETSKLGSSPQINRFLAREPPDGCEKVQSKSLTCKKFFPLENIPQPTQPSTFKLKPSLGSAFQILQPVRIDTPDQDLPIVPSQDNE